ncbi:ArsR/SmtB family transcription factor [Arsenicicoccus dermatophilus]|uniref:ArsR/SmtB family transcription factor n=1 Tax=Arsenicicoccus dermatophilus TaxID=1076331 RepID=UPI001F4C549E|nr:metalloregulator ArsR/SmtB family transcription factor [Arsenicicoccus dermatophilus]MCH8611619.1 metalloregulator ArsR/SmtB family transcription factor [Arsenicicoccus dermatophilus]
MDPRRATLPDRDDVRPVDFERAAELFALLGSPVRVRLLWHLVEHEQDVTTLAEAAQVPLATASHHLGRLRMAGVVEHRADGRRQVYSLQDPHLVQLVSEGVDHVADLRRHP